MSDMDDLREVASETARRLMALAAAHDEAVEHIGEGMLENAECLRLAVELMDLATCVADAHAKLMGVTFESACETVREHYGGSSAREDS